MSHGSDDGEEDELSSPSLTSLRVTPRLASKRSASEALGSGGSGDTPYTNLRKLASTIRATSVTPSAQQQQQQQQQQQHRAPSVSAASDSKVGGSSATAARRYGVVGTTGKYPRPVPAKRSAPSTPHAIRALEQRRRAALTPSREQRRRSGRQQRDSPRDILRNLSRVLAAKIKSPEPETVPAQEERSEGEDEGEGSEDDELSRPRLSLPIDVDDSIEMPPEMSVLDEDLTQRSVEVGRRAITEPFNRRQSRFSEGLLLTPEQKVQAAADVSFRRPDSSGMSIDIGDSILESDRQGDDTADIGRTISGDRGDSPQDDSTQTNEGLGEIGFDDSTFRFDIPLDLPPVDQVETPKGHEEDGSSAGGEDGGLELYEGTGTLDAMQESPEISEVEEDDRVAAQSARSPQTTKRRGKVLHKSRHGLPVPSLPTGVVKSIASSFVGSSSKGSRKLNKDTVAALVQATDWYFEQLGDDLAAYSKHAKRKTIAEADVIALMKRQRLLSATSTPFSLAQKFLPRELLQELRMPPPPDDVPKRRGRQKHAETEEPGSADSDAESE